MRSTERGPAKPTPLESVRREAAGCTACNLYKRATQTVFGEGPAHARIMLVGEQPGHEEDLAGRPFVGPAGRVLDEALQAAGLDRNRVYVTNAVKHVKWKAAGKRRIHDRPRRDEVEACRPWFEEELRTVRPRVVVCLGATAAWAVLRRSIRIGAERGRLLSANLPCPVLVTVHPSAILRMPEAEQRRAERRRFATDLAMAARAALR
jgi:uracil-DNA glycosylase family protein